MATQYAPIAKDSSINTTENTPRNIADVLAEELSAIEQAIAGGSGSGGHTIVNASGTDMTQREKMQFVDAVVTDDAVNDVTKISTTPASYPASQVSYKNGSVEDALDEIHEIKNSVNVTAENLYTYTTPGTYCVYLTSSVSPLTAGDLCVLEVFTIKFNGTTTGHVQRLNRVYPTTGAKIFQRVYYAVGGWSAWREV